MVRHSDFWQRSMLQAHAINLMPPRPRIPSTILAPSNYMRKRYRLSITDIVNSYGSQNVFSDNGAKSLSVAAPSIQILQQARNDTSRCPSNGDVLLCAVCPTS